MPLPPELMKTLLEKFKERAGLVSTPTASDLLTRLQASAAGLKGDEAEAPPRMIIYYGGVNKFAGQAIKVNLADLKVKTKHRGDVLDRMREGWRRAR